MTSTCQRVSERIAMGEPLGGLHDHLRTCPACAELARLPGLLQEVSAAKRTLEPPPGFAHRAVSRARARSRAMRARRRFSIGAGLVGAAAASVMAFAILGDGSRQTEIDAPAPAAPTRPPQTPHQKTDHELARDLAEITDLDHTLTIGADWNKIEEPVAAAGILLDAEDIYEP